MHKSAHTGMPRDNAEIVRHYSACASAAPPGESAELAKYCSAHTQGCPVWRKCGICRTMWHVHSEQPLPDSAQHTINATRHVVHIPGSTTQIKKVRNHAYNRLPSPESTPSSQAAHQEAHALTTTGLQKPFTLSLYRGPFSRLGEIDISSKPQAQTKKVKQNREKEECASNEGIWKSPRVKRNILIK